MVGALLLVMVSLVGVGCGGSGLPGGSALEKPYVSRATINIPFPVGQGTGNSLISAVNTSRQPLALVSVRLVGRGLGTVFRVMKAQAAPLASPADTANPGIYHVYPPADQLGRPPRCRVQRLYPISGFVARPGEDVRLYFEFRAVHPGELVTSGVDVMYRQNGNEYHQFLPVGFTMTVKQGVRVQPLYSYEKPCVGLRGVVALPPLDR